MRSLATFPPSFIPTRRVISFAAFIAMLAFAVELLPPAAVHTLTRESGPFEICSAVLLGLAAGVAAARALCRRSLASLAGVITLAALTLRELDFQKRFTYRSIESIGFYTRPIASWQEKTMAVVFLAVVGIAAAVVVRAGWRCLRTALARGDRWPGYLTVAVALGALAFASEKFLHLTAAEEVFETGFAALVLTFTCAGVRSPCSSRLRLVCDRLQIKTTDVPAEPVVERPAA